MAEFRLVRHASHDRVGKALMGRQRGVSLGDAGRTEVRGLAAHFASKQESGRPLAAVYSSPMERAFETAAPIADAVGLTVRLLPEFVEVDFGEWTGKAFDELEPSADWRAWNSDRTLARPPGGETMLTVQARAVDAIERLANEHGGESVAIVSHADVIRATLFHYLGLSLDHLLRVEISPASISILQRAGSWARIDCVNRQVAA